MRLGDLFLGIGVCVLLNACTPKFRSVASNAPELLQSAAESPTPTPLTGDEFISIWQTSSPNETITLPLRAGYNYNFIVDWGDGTTSEVTSDNDPDITHEYGAADNYTVTISGTAEAWYFNNAGDRNKIIEVVNFGNLGWINLDNAFSGCENLVSFAGGNTDNVVDMNSMFAGTTLMTAIDLSTFDTSQVTNMNALFSGMTALTEIDLSNFDTSSVENMRMMFINMTSLEELDVSNFDTSNVTNMTSMFDNCNRLTELDLSEFNTSSVTNMQGMFAYMSSLTSLDISSFDTANVQNMSGMFQYVTDLTSLDLSHFDTSKVTDMHSMFEDMYALTSLDVSNFDTSIVTDMSNMFFHVEDLNNLDVSSFNTANVTNMSLMFATMVDLTSLDISNFDTSIVTNMSSMFVNCQSLTELDLSNFDTASVPNLFQTFAYMTNLSELNTLNWDITLSAASTDVFTGTNAGLSVICDQGGSPGTGNFFGKACAAPPPPPFVSVWRMATAGQSITLPLRNGYNYNFTVDWGDGTTDGTVTSWNDADATHTYAGAGDFTVTISGTVQAWYSPNQNDSAAKLIQVVDLGDVGWIDLTGAFSECYNLISVAGGVTTNVTSMDSMFYFAVSLTSLDMSTWNTSNVTNMSRMFSVTRDLHGVDFSQLETSNVTDFGYMFAQSEGFTTLDLSSFDTSNLESTRAMFFMATSITSINMGGWNTPELWRTDSMFFGTDNLVSVNVTDWDISGVTGGWSGGIYDNTNVGLTMTCNQGGSPGTGTFFGKSCN